VHVSEHHGCVGRAHCIGRGRAAHRALCRQRGGSRVMLLTGQLRYRRSSEHRAKLVGPLRRLDIASRVAKCEE